MTLYALSYAKHAAEGVLFKGFSGNPYIAERQYYNAIEALREQGTAMFIIAPRPFGGEL
jgi:hypothetical protein